MSAHRVRLTTSYLQVPVGVTVDDEAPIGAHPITLRMGDRIAFLTLAEARKVCEGMQEAIADAMQWGAR